MKPIKKGMTEAVTRDGRKVTQLTWFDTKEEYKIYGVIDKAVFCWRENGRYCIIDNKLDIFAPVEYEWQWLIYDKRDNTFELTVHCKSEDEAKESIKGYTLIKRIEESKREVLTE